MPQVPIYDTQNAELSGGGFGNFAAGPAVQPIDDRTGKNIAEAGKAMTDAGTAVSRIAQRLEDNINDARTKAADTAFTAGVQKLLYDPNEGYLNKLGKNATDARQGAIDAINQLRKDTIDGLETDVQRHMFGTIADRHVNTFMNQIDTHAAKQTSIYLTGESDARANQYVSLAIANAGTRDQQDANGKPIGPYNQYRATAIAEANAAADTLQLPADSAQRADIVRKKTTAIVNGVVSNLTLENKFAEGKAFVEKALKDGDVDASTAATLTKQLDAGYRKEQGVSAGDRIFSARGPQGTDSSSIISYIMKHEGGYVENDAGRGPTNYGINAQAYFNLKSPKDITPEQRDFIKNLTPAQAEKIYRDKYWTPYKLDEIPENMRAMVFDGLVNQGTWAMQAYKQSGNDPQKFMQLRRDRYDAIIASDEQKKGQEGYRNLAQYRNSWNARMARLDGSGGERSLSNMLLEADAIQDPDEREIAKARIKNRFSEDEAAQKQDYDNKLKSATDIAFAKPGGWKDIPPQVWADLRQEDRARLMQQPRGDDPATVLLLDTHPELWKADQLIKYRGLISESRYQSYYKQGNGPSAEKNVINASIDNDQFADALNVAGLHKLVHPKKDSEDEKMSVQLRDRFRVAVEAEQQARKRELTTPEKREILNSLIKPVKVKMIQTGGIGRLFGALGPAETTDDMRAFQVKNPQNIIIPEDAKKKIAADFSARGIQLTPERLLTAYLMTQEASK